MNQPSTEKTASELRLKAEENLAQRPPSLRSDEPATQRLLHELQVHQVELEMQNEALHESSQLLRETQRIAQIGGWELTLGDQTLICSDEVLNIFDLPAPAGAVSYTAFRNAIHPDDRADVLLNFDNAIRDRRAFETRYRLQTTDGSVKFIHEYDKMVCDATGLPVSVVGVVQDITLQVLREEALQESEERFHVIADFTFGWEYWMGPQGEFLYVSPVCESVSGYAQSEFISHPVLIREIVHPDDRSLIEAHHKDLRNPNHCELDFRIVRKDGRVCWISHGCRPVYGRDGRFLGRRASNRDITERIRLAEALQRSEQRFHTLFDRSPDPTWIIDGHRFVECNQAAADMLGYPDKHALLNAHPSMLSPEYQPDGESSFEKAEHMMAIVEQAGIHRFEWVHKRADDSEFLAEVTLSAITLQNRPVIYCVWRDITHRTAALEQAMTIQAGNPS